VAASARRHPERSGLVGEAFYVRTFYSQLWLVHVLALALQADTDWSVSKTFSIGRRRHTYQDRLEVRKRFPAAEGHSLGATSGAARTRGHGDARKRAGYRRSVRNSATQHAFEHVLVAFC
jgi:hypothetical protein